MIAADERLPLWVRVADAAVLLLLAVWSSVAIFGGFTVVFGPVVITAHSSGRLLAIAAGILLVRHGLKRSPAMTTRLRRAVARWWQVDAVRDVLPPFLWSRAAVFLVAYLSISTFGYVTTPPFRVAHNEFANLPARWDGGWYLLIADKGYLYDRSVRGQQNVAFFPAYPLAMRAGGMFTGAHVRDAKGREQKRVRLLWSGVMLNLAAFAAALIYLHRMAGSHAGREAALAAVGFALAYPAAFFFNAPYTEGLFLLSTVAAFYYLQRGQLMAAASWGFLAGAARPNGFLLAAPLLAIAVARVLPRSARLLDRLAPSDTGPRHRLTTLATACTPIAGMLAFGAYLHARWGDPFLWARLHREWGRTYQGFEAVVKPVQTVAEQGFGQYAGVPGYELLNILPFLLAAVLAIPIALRLGLAYAALILFTILPPLVAGGWLSMARVTVVLFPMYLFLGITVPARHRTGVVAAFALLQALGAALFFTWRPFY